MHHSWADAVFVCAGCHEKAINPHRQVMQMGSCSHPHLGAGFADERFAESPADSFVGCMDGDAQLAGVFALRVEGVSDAIGSSNATSPSSSNRVPLLVAVWLDSRYARFRAAAALENRFAELCLPTSAPR
jgi:hypothetical protein